jgi:hypothetical protein
MGDDDDRLLPGLYPPSSEQSMSGYYGQALRAAVRAVRAVPRAWPRPVRTIVQILVGVVTGVLVVAAWICTTLLLIVSNMGVGRRSGGLP